jgi:hypothetical protein
MTAKPSPARLARARAVLVGALTVDREWMRRREGARVDDLVTHLRTAATPAERRLAPARQLARMLARYGVRSEERRAWLLDVVGREAHRLVPPRSDASDGARAEAWRALLLAAAELSVGGVRSLGRLPFVDDDRFDALVREARRQLPGGRLPRTRAARPSGPVLRRLAADPRLRRVAGRALGHALVPAGAAVYLYDAPRSHVRPHLDARPYDVIVHLVLEHTRPSTRSRGSALVVYRSAGVPVRLRVPPAEAVVLGGRGSVHEWQPLARAERRTLLAIGFTRPRSRRGRLG